MFSNTTQKLVIVFIGKIIQFFSFFFLLYLDFFGPLGLFSWWTNYPFLCFFFFKWSLIIRAEALILEFHRAIYSTFMEFKYERLKALLKNELFKKNNSKKFAKFGFLSRLYVHFLRLAERGDLTWGRVFSFHFTIFFILLS